METTSDRFGASAVASGRGSSLPGVDHLLLGLIAALVLLRAAVYVPASLFLDWGIDPQRIVPPWLQLSQGALFAACGLVVLAYGRTDIKAVGLGLFLTDVGSTLIDPFTASLAATYGTVAVATAIRSDAFQAALLWYVAWVFPSRQGPQWLDDMFRIGFRIATALGALLISLEVLPFEQLPRSFSILLAARRHAPGADDWFFTLQFSCLIPLLVLVPMKFGRLSAVERRRASHLLAGVALGFAPLILDILATTLWPRYHQLSGTAPISQARGAAVMSGLALIPTSTLYAAVVDRSIFISIGMRSALRYMVVFVLSWTLVVLPVVVATGLLWANREAAVGDLAKGPLGLALGSLTALASLGVLFQQRINRSLDLAFRRRDFDASAALLSFAARTRECSSVDALVRLMVSVVETAVQPHAVSVAVADEAGFFRRQDADGPELPIESPLAQLVGGGDDPFVVRDATAVISRLPAGEKAWIEATGAELLLPMRGAAGQALGIVAVGPNVHGLRLSRTDQSFLAAIGTAGGLALERLVERARAAAADGQTDAEPFAQECVECGTVLTPAARYCECGGLLQRAAVPSTVSDRLQFIRRLGAGGMGVVYLALDLRVRQVRAVKTLPRLDPALVSRLEREARAMAAVDHPNVATLYGVEFWRGRPLLIMEYFDGGTLADRLSRGSLELTMVLRAGAAMARGLSAVHRAGLQHRDIKPSNVGFTSDGTPKLFDFGLAKGLPTPLIGTGGLAAREVTKSASLDGESLRGTPAYLSPEILGGTPPSARDDLWSLGVTLLEAATGSNPFRAQTPASSAAMILNSRNYLLQHVEGYGAERLLVFLNVLGTQAERPETAEDLVQLLMEALERDTRSVKETTS